MLAQLVLLMWNVLTKDGEGNVNIAFSKKSDKTFFIMLLLGLIQLHCENIKQRINVKEAVAAYILFPQKTPILILFFLSHSYIHSDGLNIFI